LGAGFDSLLRGLDVDTVIVTVLHTNRYCRHTSADICVLDYKIVVPRETADTYTEDRYKGELDYLKRIYKVEVKRLALSIGEPAAVKNLYQYPD